MHIPMQPTPSFITAANTKRTKVTMKDVIEVMVVGEEGLIEYV